MQACIKWSMVIALQSLQCKTSTASETWKMSHWGCILILLEYNWNSLPPALFSDAIISYLLSLASFHTYVVFCWELINVVHFDLIRSQVSQHTSGAKSHFLLPLGAISLLFPHSSLMCLLCWINFSSSTHISQDEIMISFLLGADCIFQTDKYHSSHMIFYFLQTINRLFQKKLVTHYESKQISWYQADEKINNSLLHHLVCAQGPGCYWT